MKPFIKTIIIATFALLSFSLAQQSATVSGIIKAEPRLEENSRVMAYALDERNSRVLELSSVAPVAGTFSLTLGAPPADILLPLRSGGVMLPGLQTEYSVFPEGVNYVRAYTVPYVDLNLNQYFDGFDNEPAYSGIASVENPVGFFNLIYVDRDVDLIGNDIRLTLRAGWNVFTVRFSEDNSTVYGVQPSISDVTLDVMFPE